MKGLARILPVVVLFALLQPLGVIKKEGAQKTPSNTSVPAQTQEIEGQDVADLYNRHVYDVAELFGGKDPEEPVVGG
jgi:hypothetical protein